MEGSAILGLFTKQLWMFGVEVTAHLVIYLTVLTIVAQVIWAAYRYVTDAAKTFEDSSRSYTERDRVIFCGDWLSKVIPDPMPGCETYSNDLGKFIGIICIYCVCGLASALVWPLLIVYGALHGSLFGMRAVLRFKKKVNEALKNKADKDHNHDDRYVQK